MKPELRDMSTLRAADFDRVALWLQCHFADGDEPWYDETDECTVRPYSGPTPVAASESLYVVRATATLADGSRLSGCIVPSAENDPGVAQPVLFVGEAAWVFWGGALGVPEEERDALYRALGKEAEAVFPITFSVTTDLVHRQANVRVDGFYRVEGMAQVIVER